MKGKIVLPLVIALACLISNNAMAVSGRATDAVRGMMDQVIAIQNNQGLQGQEGQATKKTEIRNVILKNFNFEEMMKGALGQYYSSLNQAQAHRVQVGLSGPLSHFICQDGHGFREE